MRKALVALSMTTVAFAMSTAYLARGLQLERTRPVAPQSIPQVVEVAPVPAPDAHRAQDEVLVSARRQFRQN